MADRSPLIYGVGFASADGLNLRSAADLNSQVLCTAYKGDCAVILEQQGDWYRVIYNLQEGYMHASYINALSVENVELGNGSINGDGVNLRSGPGISYPSVMNGSINEQCYVIGVNMGWYKVLCRNAVCYIRSDYLTLYEIPYENRSSANAPQYYRGGKSIGNTEGFSSPQASAADASVGRTPVSGSDITHLAESFLGAPYVNGGASPSGFDCSGFVYYVLTSLGQLPGRTPEEQYQQGEPVNRSQLLPGDIVFFSGNGSTVSHCGIYAGNGQFIHAPNSRSVVSYSDLTSGYWNEHYYGARRTA